MSLNDDFQTGPVTQRSVKMDGFKISEEKHKGNDKLKHLYIKISPALTSVS
jgi:hypothetical protein